MARPRKPRIPLPPHVNPVRARGKDYYYFQPQRGTARAGKPIRIAGHPANPDGSPNEEWWEAYRNLAGNNERRLAPWPWEELEHFAKHARPDLWHAAALALYSSQRLSDALKVKWSDINNGQISVRQGKTGKSLWIPIHRKLAAILATLRRDSIYVLTSSRRARGAKDAPKPFRRPATAEEKPPPRLPWTVDGFKASWSNELNREVMKPLRAKRLVFHGLRKSAVVMLLEAGATDAEVSAVTGQSREMVEHYSRQVNQRKLAAAAILKWEAADNQS